MREEAGFETTEQLVSVAKLYYEDGLNQHEIARLQGISRSSVSRMLDRARQHGLVQIVVRAATDRDAELEQQLCEAYELREAIVARSPTNSDNDLLRHTIGRATGLYLSALIRAGDVVGISRGRTLHAVISAMPRPARHQSMTVVQLMGGTAATLEDSHASELTRQFAELYQGHCYNLHSPALVPNSATRAGIVACTAVAPTIALYQQLRIAMVGIGSLSDSLFLLGGALTDADLAHLRAAGAAGEICGRFVTSSGEECASRLRDLAVGVTLDDLRRCEYVIGVAGGLSKVDAINAFLRARLLNVLATDEITARALLKLHNHSARV